MCESEFNYIQKQFFWGVPVTKINWENTLKNKEWEQQNELIEQTICSKLNLQFPVKRSYQISFLKYAIKELELHCSEVHDILYEQLTEKLKELPEEFCYKSYMLPENEVVSIKEAVNFIKDGTTGLSVWQASFATSDYLIKHKDIFNQKTVLELGSGIGLVGSILMKLCKPKKLILSDCHSKVLNLLTENISVNMLSPDEVTTLDSCTLVHKNYNLKEMELAILNLPWEEAETHKDKLREICLPDIILGADLVYDDSLFDNLIDCLNVIYENTQNKCIALFFCTIRNKETFSIFMGKLNTHKYQVDNLGEFTPETFYWDESLPKTVLIKISKN